MACTFCRNRKIACSVTDPNGHPEGSETMGNAKVLEEMLFGPFRRDASGASAPVGGPDSGGKTKGMIRRPCNRCKSLKVRSQYKSSEHTPSITHVDLLLSRSGASMSKGSSLASGVFEGITSVSSQNVKPGAQSTTHIDCSVNVARKRTDKSIDICRQREVLLRETLTQDARIERSLEEIRSLKSAERGSQFAGTSQAGA